MRNVKNTSRSRNHWNNIDLDGSKTTRKRLVEAETAGSTAGRHEARRTRCTCAASDDRINIGLAYVGLTEEERCLYLGCTSHS